MNSIKTWIVTDSVQFRKHKKECLYQLFQPDGVVPNGVVPNEVVSNEVVSDGLGPGPVWTLCDNLERGIYNYALAKASEKNIVKNWDNAIFVQLYIERLRTIFTNMATYAKLRTSFLNKELPAHKYAFMTHQEMCPERWEERIAEKKVRDEFKYTPRQEASTDQFTCRKCKSKQCTYYQLQTRSADEPMTTFVTCIACGCRWRCWSLYFMSFTYANKISFFWQKKTTFAIHTVWVSRSR